MTFRFQCPRGHLLEGDESLGGTRWRCPECNILFLVPQAVTPPPVAGPRGPRPPGEQPTQAKIPETLPEIQLTPLGNRPKKTADAEAARALSEPEIFHIPCPKGHLLETPREMLGQYVECPFCKARFHVRREMSVEYQRKQAEEEEIRQLHLGRAWLRWAIVAAVLVVLALVGLGILVRAS